MPMLQVGDQPFSIGRAPFFDNRPEGHNELSARVYINVAVEKMNESFLFLLDTGAPWSVVTREIAQEAGLLDAEGQDFSIKHHAGTMPGKLVPATLTLVAEEGDSLEVEASIFVPENDFPPPGNFIGYQGFLERIKLGLDPQNNDVYFGC